jgi:lipopolysaccharide export system permease protein
VQELISDLNNSDIKSRSASLTELSKRFSFPFSCMAFALIGVPLGVTAHRRETSIGFALGLVVAISYFLFVILADTLRMNAHAHPELLVWFPNVLFLGIGLWLFRRLGRR